MSRQTSSTCSTVRPRARRDFGRRLAVLKSVEAEVHHRIRHRKVELLLALRQRPGVGRRRPRADLLRQAEMCGERIDLRLVEMRDRLDVRRAVAVLHEKALVIFEPVGRAEHGVVQPVGVEIFELLARALLHVGRRHNAEIDIERHAHRLPLAVGRLHHELRDVVGARVGRARPCSPSPRRTRARACG